MYDQCVKQWFSVNIPWFRNSSLGYFCSIEKKPWVQFSSGRWVSKRLIVWYVFLAKRAKPKSLLKSNFFDDRRWYLAVEAVHVDQAHHSVAVQVTTHGFPDFANHFLPVFPVFFPDVGEVSCSFLIFLLLFLSQKKTKVWRQFQNSLNLQWRHHFLISLFIFLGKKKNSKKALIFKWGNPAADRKEKSFEAKVEHILEFVDLWRNEKEAQGKEKKAFENQMSSFWWPNASSFTRKSPLTAFQYVDRGSEFQSEMRRLKSSSQCSSLNHNLCSCTFTFPLPQTFIHIDSIR